MNENPGETPNPLNPNPGLGARPNPNPRPGTLDANPSGPAMPTASPASVSPVEMPASPDTVVEPMAPAGGKKKTGLVVGILVALFLAVGCGVAAVLLSMNQNAGDPVAAAVNKIMTGKAPENVAAKGTINVAIDSDDSIVTNLKVDLDAEVITSSLINSSKATLTATLKNGGEVKVDVNEMRAADGDLYLKVDGLIEALKNPKLIRAMVYGVESDDDVLDCTGDDEDCVKEVDVDEEAVVEDEGLEEGGAYFEEEVALEESTLDDDELEESILTEYTEYLTKSYSGIDGEWLRISMDEITEMTKDSDTTECASNLISDLNSNRNTFAEIYNKNAFIGSAAGEVTVAKKTDPIYQVAFDKEKLADFMADLDSSDVIKNFNECQTKNNEETVSIVENQDDIMDALSEMPAIYVEVNKDNNITRFYTSASAEGTSVTIDLDFSYPTNVNVTEPEEYKELTEVIQKLFMTVYED